jgi:hypothetical protein
MSESVCSNAILARGVLHPSIPLRKRRWLAQSGQLTVTSLPLQSLAHLACLIVGCKLQTRPCLSFSFLSASFSSTHLSYKQTLARISSSSILSKMSHYPPQQQQSPALPPPWLAEWDQRDQRWLFVNPQTGQRTFEHPHPTYQPQGGYGGGYPQQGGYPPQGGYGAGYPPQQSATVADTHRSNSHRKTTTRLWSMVRWAPWQA